MKVKKKIYVERGNEKMTRTDQAGDFFDKLKDFKKYLLFTSLTYKHVNVFRYFLSLSVGENLVFRWD